jgi:NAD(P)-dependent dehydrogenase (short-subunit alcohol dehydrogenase family)
LINNNKKENLSEEIDMTLTNKVVIVTGASKGIGRGIALIFAEKRATVVIADIDEKQGKQLEEQICSHGGQSLFVKTDVRKEADIFHLMEFTNKTFGSIHILINNAGKGGAFKSPYDLSLEEWDDIINTNLRSVFIASKEAAKYIRQNKNGGSIVNISSTRAFMSEPNSEPYAASKGGIIAITHALATSFGNDRITVNSISPGWIETGDYTKLSEMDHGQHLSNRVGKPDDIARACLFLTSEENDFITGANLVVDGGMTKKMIYFE